MSYAVVTAPSFNLGLAKLIHIEHAHRHTTEAAAARHLWAS